MKKLIYFIGLYHVCIWLHDMLQGLVIAVKDPEKFGRLVGKNTNEIIEKYSKGFDAGVKESEEKPKSKPGPIGFHV